MGVPDTENSALHIVMTRRHDLGAPDGVNTTIFGLASALMEHGHTVSVVARAGSPRDRILAVHPEAANVPILRVPWSIAAEPEINGLTATWVLRGRRLLQQLEPDVVVHHDGPLPLALDRRTMSIAYNGARDPSRFRRRYKQFAQRHSGQPVAVTSEVRDAIARELAVAPRAIPIIPPLVLADHYRGVGLPDREPAIVHRGTLPYENPLATIAAVTELEGDVPLYVTGPITEEIRDARRSLPLEVRRRVHLLGAVPAQQERELLARVRVVSYPRCYEVPTASSALLEAYACGTPVVGSTLVSADVLQDGHQGHRTPSDDPAGVAAHLRTVLTDDVRWPALSAAARDTAEAHDAAIVADRYLEAFAALPPGSTSALR